MYAVESVVASIFTRPARQMKLPHTFFDFMLAKFFPHKILISLYYRDAFYATSHSGLVTFNTEA